MLTFYGKWIPKDVIPFINKSKNIRFVLGNHIFFKKGSLDAYDFTEKIDGNENVNNNYDYTIKASCDHILTFKNVT